MSDTTSNASPFPTPLCKEEINNRYKKNKRVYIGIHTLLGILGISCILLFLMAGSYYGIDPFFYNSYSIVAAVYLVMFFICAAVIIHSNIGDYYHYKQLPTECYTDISKWRIEHPEINNYINSVIKLDRELIVLDYTLLAKYVQNQTNKKEQLKTQMDGEKAKHEILNTL